MAATTTEPKKPSESVGELDSMSKEDSSSDGNQPGKVTFGAFVIVGNLRPGLSLFFLGGGGGRRWWGGGKDDSEGKKTGGGQSVVISGIANDTGGTGMRSHDSGECSGGHKSDPNGKTSLVQSLAQLTKTQNQMVKAHTRAMFVQGPSTLQW